VRPRPPSRPSEYPEALSRVQLQQAAEAAGVVAVRDGDSKVTVTSDK